jgi:hypothetical protein
MEAVLVTGAAMSRPARCAESGRLRLTRRGQIVLGVLGVLLALGLAQGGAAVAGGSSAPQVVDIHVVAAGETVWGYARDIAGHDEDVRDVVAEILRLNSLGSAQIVVGQRILLPQQSP